MIIKLCNECNTTPPDIRTNDNPNCEECGTNYGTLKHLNTSTGCPSCIQLLEKYLVDINLCCHVDDGELTIKEDTFVDLTCMDRVLSSLTNIKSCERIEGC